MILETLREYVAGIEATHWAQAVEQLRRTRCWEYEGLSPHLSR